MTFLFYGFVMCSDKAGMVNKAKVSWQMIGNSLLTFKNPNWYNQSCLPSCISSFEIFKTLNPKIYFMLQKEIKNDP